MSQGTFDPAKRRLCPDGVCIGLIGDDGRCRVCGRAGDGLAGGSPTLSSGFGSDGSDNLPDDLEDDAFDDEANPGEIIAGGAAGDPDGFQASRRLCDDGSCVGVIRDDGRCSVCGRAAGA